MTFLIKREDLTTFNSFALLRRQEQGFNTGSVGGTAGITGRAGGTAGITELKRDRTVLKVTILGPRTAESQ